MVYPDLVPISIVCVHSVHDWMIKFDCVFRRGMRQRH